MNCFLRSRKQRNNMASFPSALLFFAFLWGFSPTAAGQVLGLLPAGMSPDSVDFTASELYVLERGKVSVFSLPDIVRRRTFGGSGNGPGKLAPRHHFDQALRVIGDRVLVEDNNKIIVFSTAGQLMEEKRKPESTIWFIPIGDRFVAKSMVVSGQPPTQYIRLVLYDSKLHEIKELYRQEWFQQQDPPGFSTMLLGDLLHFAVVQDKICVEESPKGFVIELFDPDGNKISTIKKSIAGIRVTEQDRDREMTLVRKEKRVAAMIALTGSWEKLRQIWKISFPETTPALRELQSCGDNLLVRTFERRANAEKYLLLGLDGTIQRELFLPFVSDAETEARVSGTAFFKLIGERFFYLWQNDGSDRWEVRLAKTEILKEK